MNTVTRPVRTCVGCRQRAAKDDLLRVVADDLGHGLEVMPDPRGRAPGRGAHVHPTAACVELASRRRAFSRALRVAGGLDSRRLRAHVQELAPPSGGTDTRAIVAETPMTESTRRWSSSS